MSSRKIVEKLRLKVRAGRIKAKVSERGFEVRLDRPTSPVDGPFALVIGVLFVKNKVKIESAELRTDQNEVVRVLLHDRPDLTRDYKGVDSHGFTVILENAGDDNNTSCTLIFRVDGLLIEHPIKIEFGQKRFGTFLHQKKEKLHRIQDILQCPECTGPMEGGEPVCPNCKRTHAVNDRAYDFREDGLRNELNSAREGNISAHNYDRKALSLIEKHSGGLILDNGCGLRETYYQNVVNFEIADYPTTDVLGVGEKLPFRDESFDAVFSLSVLEHVRDPFRCVSEIMRVLKPGGDLFVAVPFLQPFHGYPNHYYNMTSSGLKQLFEGRAEIDEIGVSRAGHPFWSLQWILANYANGLSEKESIDFKNLRIGELISPDPDLQETLLAQLDNKKREELASFNYLLGKKPTN